MCHLDEKPLGLRATNDIGIKVRWVVGPTESNGIYEVRAVFPKHFDICRLTILS